MPRKTGRRGYGWSRIRSGCGRKRKRESENGAGIEDASSYNQTHRGRMIIGPENGERWSKLRLDLGFTEDTDFAAYLLDLAERKGLTTKGGPIPQSSSSKDNMETFPATSFDDPTTSQSDQESISQPSEEDEEEEEEDEEESQMVTADESSRNDVTEKKPTTEDEQLSLVMEIA